MVQDDRVLLENRGSQWRLPGGHVEAGENPVEAIHREAKEELGVDVRFLREDELFPATPDAYSLPTPWRSFAHVVDADGAIHEKHENIILAFIVVPVGIPSPLEGQDIRWFSDNELTDSSISQIVAAIAGEGLRSYQANNK